MSRIEGFLIDLDGVIYTGQNLISGARAALKYLDTSGYSYRFVSNTTRKCRSTIARQLAEMGLEIPEAYIFTPPRAAVVFMKQRGNPHFRLLVAGDVRADFPDECNVRTDSVPEYLVIGDAGDLFTYQILNAAFRDLMGGAELIALEQDRYWMAQDGLSLSAGPFVAALEYATGKRASLMGKPSKTFFDLALQDMGIPAERAVMIGDDIHTDVGGAQAAGMRGVLVRTGKFQESQAFTSAIRPDHIIDSIAMIEEVITAADRGDMRGI